MLLTQVPEHFNIILHLHHIFNTTEKKALFNILYPVILMIKQLYKWQEKIFDFIIYSSYILIIISALGLSETAPKYLQSLDYYIRVYICLFLIWRFNPLRSSYDFTELDRKIAFSAGVFILTTTALNQYLDDFKSNIKNVINNNI